MRRRDVSYPDQLCRGRADRWGTRRRPRKLPIPFAFEVAIDSKDGSFECHGETRLGDGWYWEGPYTRAVVVRDGRWYSGSCANRGAWKRQFALYECAETGGAKHPDLWQEVLERRSVERQLLWMCKQMEMEEEA